ncbi:DUF3043 domain-containing protein [Arthrobacter sp. H5]|uniref:DUF3043 domain-containing protein n=1 Tax=Arthrobacter sp. H5 TaxID=1267973 RepID=UPI000480946F|nr:DUF3043 domain-containing protein [Arthrobacter sp. H5]
MFGRKKEAPAAQDVLDQLTAEQSLHAAGKGVPTPKRSAQEAARRRPLVPNDRKAAKEAGRTAQREERLRMRQALDTGDERFLPFRDKGPNRRFVRDTVDARWNLGEFLMIAALVFVVFSFIPSLSVQSIVMLAFWVIIVAVVLDCILLRRKLKSRLTEKFGEPMRGDLWYGITRALQIRRLRLPKPQVGRGQAPS